MNRHTSSILIDLVPYNFEGKTLYSIQINGTAIGEYFPEDNHVQIEADSFILEDALGPTIAEAIRRRYGTTPTIDIVT